MFDLYTWERSYLVGGGERLSRRETQPPVPQGRGRRHVEVRTGGPARQRGTVWQRLLQSASVGRRLGTRR